jgi:hypothetical protein
VLKTSNIGISLFKPVELLIALTAIYKVSSSLTPFNSKEIISYTQYSGI